MKLIDALPKIPDSSEIIKFVGDLSRQPPLLIIFAEAIQHVDIVKQFGILTTGLRTGFGEKYQGDLTLLPNNPSANPDL